MVKVVKMKHAFLHTRPLQPEALRDSCCLHVLGTRSEGERQWLKHGTTYREGEDRRPGREAPRRVHRSGRRRF